MKKLILAAVLFAGTSTAAFAGDGCITIWGFTLFCLPPPPVQHNPVTAPEIDPASALAGLALMAGGLAVLRGRRTKA